MPEEIKKHLDDDWETESGLPDDFDCWIVDAKFGYLAEYTDSQGRPVPLLLWYCESPDVDLEQPIPWSLGSGWQIRAEGARVEHKDGRKRFVDSSMYGRLINRVVKDLGVNMRSRGSAKEAKVWVGLGFHMKREEVKYEGLMPERGGKTSRLMPVSYLGDRREKGKVVELPKQAKSLTEEEVTIAARETFGEFQPEDLMARLKKLALEHDQCLKFQMEAIKIPEVRSDNELKADILNDGEDGFWARVWREARG
jgi:hypothetical protein